MLGAGLLLPRAVGYSVGILLSVTYFIVVAFSNIRREHPLRRLLLICVFGVGSTYTSFFSIYQQMSEVPLEYQAVERTVEAHNQFINRHLLKS